MYVHIHVQCTTNMSVQCMYVCISDVNDAKI